MDPALFKTYQVLRLHLHQFEILTKYFGAEAEHKEHAVELQQRLLAAIDIDQALLNDVKALLAVYAQKSIDAAAQRANDEAVSSCQSELESLLDFLITITHQHKEDAQVLAHVHDVMEHIEGLLKELGTHLETKKDPVYALLSGGGLLDYMHFQLLYKNEGGEALIPWIDHRLVYVDKLHGTFTSYVVKGPEGLQVLKIYGQRGVGGMGGREIRAYEAANNAHIAGVPKLYDRYSGTTPISYSALRREYIDGPTLDAVPPTAELHEKLWKLLADLLSVGIHFPRDCKLEQFIVVQGQPYLIDFGECSLAEPSPVTVKQLQGRGLRGSPDVMRLRGMLAAHKKQFGVVEAAKPSLLKRLFGR